MPTEPVAPLCIGDWRFLPDRHMLDDGREQRRLPRRLVAVLAELARTPSVAVPRERLIAAGWRRRVIDDEVLSRAVAELRQALGDSAKSSRYIETIPTLGYRLIAPVTFIVETSNPLPSRRKWQIAVFTLVLAATGTATWLSWPHITPEIPWTAARFAAELPYASAPGWEFDPRFSRDGRWIAYVRNDEPGGLDRIRISAADGSAARDLTPEPGRHSTPIFVSGSDDVIYAWHRDGRCELRRQSVLAGAARRIGDCAPHAGGLDVSSDGRALAFVLPGATPDRAGLALLDLDSGAIRSLTSPGGDGPDADPRFVPGGSRLSFVRGPVGEQRLVWLDLSRPADIEPLIADRNLIEGHAWSPDGRHVLVASDRHDYRAVIALDPADGTATRLGGRGASSIDVAADGGLLYAQSIYNANLWATTLPATAKSAQLLVRSSRYLSQPALAPDDSALVYVSTGEGRESIGLRALSDGTERRLPLDPARRWVRPAFARDGHALFVTGYDERGPHAFRHALDSGRTEPLRDTLAVVARETGDGRIVIGRASERAMTLWLARDVADTAPQSIANAGAAADFQVSGHWLVLRPEAATGLRLIDLDTGTVRDVAPRIGPHNRYDWTLRGNRLYFCDYDAARIGTLYRIDLPDGATTPLGPLAPDVNGTSFAITADESRAVFGRVDALTVDLIRVPPPAP